MRPFGERSTLNPSIALQTKTPGRIEIEHKIPTYINYFNQHFLCFKQIEWYAKKFGLLSSFPCLFGERSTLNPSIALQAKTPGRIEIEYKFLHTKIFEPTLLCFEQIELNA